MRKIFCPVPGFLQVSRHGYLCDIVWGPEASLTVGWEKKSFMNGRTMIRYKNSHHRIVGKSFVFISSTICTGLFHLVPTTSYVDPILHSFAFKFVSCHLKGSLKRTVIIVISRQTFTAICV